MLSPEPTGLVSKTPHRVIGANRGSGTSSFRVADQPIALCNQLGQDAVATVKGRHRIFWLHQVCRLATA